MSQFILLSIKPEFIEQIFNGTKTIELRKCRPDAKSGDVVIFYSTQPVKAIVGMCRISEIIESNPFHLWEIHSKNLGVTEEQFWTYYKDSSRSIGISIENVCMLREHIHLSEIKGLYPSFSPPQTFRYLTKSVFFSFYKNYLRTK